MNRHIKFAAILASLSIATAFCRADTATNAQPANGAPESALLTDTAAQSTNAAPQPFLTPLRLNVLAGTNWLGTVAAKMDFSGVYLVTLKGGKANIDRGGVATEYVIREVDWQTYMRFRPGLCVTLPGDMVTVYLGAGCVFGVVPDGKLEIWLNQAPIFELIGKAVKWSNLYGFGEVGSQYSQWQPFVAFGAGIKLW